MNGKFRKSLSGFNRNDVMNYIRKYAEEKQEQIDELEAKVAELERKVEELEKENEKIKTILVSVHKEKVELQEKINARTAIVRKLIETKKAEQELSE